MGGDRSCDAPAASVFVVGLVAGTMCILASKALFEGRARGITGELEPFQPPVFETFIMFFGMVFALPLYFAMELVKRIRAYGHPEAQAKLAAEPKVTARMLLSLAVPAVFDLSSVLLLMAGLMHIPVTTHTRREPRRLSLARSPLGALCMHQMTNQTNINPAQSQHTPFGEV